MNAQLPPPPLGPPLAVACCHNRVDEVKRLLASGADPLEDSIIDGEKQGGYRPLFICLHMGFAECVEALLVALPELVDSGATLASEQNKLPPLMFLLERMSMCARSRRRQEPTWEAIVAQPGYDPLGCVDFLLTAGASLEPVKVKGCGYTMTYYVNMLADGVGNRRLTRMLGDARRLRYSPKTHRIFPRRARYAAAELLRLGYQINSGVLSPVWAEHVLPLLVTRTSRGAAPSLSPALLFIDALSESELKKMVACGDAAKLELRRRGIGKYPPLV